MWSWVWAVLVVGMVVAAFFAGRRLWRSGVRLAREASRASAVLGSAAERISAAVAEAEANRPDTSPTLFDDPTVLQARVEERRVARAGRRAVRRERYRVTWQGWTEQTWLERRQAEKAAGVASGRTGGAETRETTGGNVRR